MGDRPRSVNPQFRSIYFPRSLRFFATGAVSLLSGGLLLGTLGFLDAASAQDMRSPNGSYAEVTEPLAASERVSVDAQIPSPDSEVTVQLSNDTNAFVTYEVIGETERYVLAPQGETTLSDIPLPATITVVRQDEGLLNIFPSVSEEGVLNVSLEEEINLDDTQGVVRVQQDGQVLIY